MKSCRDVRCFRLFQLGPSRWVLTVTLSNPLTGSETALTKTHCLRAHIGKNEMGGGEREAGLLRFSLRRLLVLIQFLALLSLPLLFSLPLFSRTISHLSTPFHICMTKWPLIVVDMHPFLCGRVANTVQTLPKAGLMINLCPLDFVCVSHVYLCCEVCSEWG